MQPKAIVLLLASILTWLAILLTIILDITRKSLWHFSRIFSRGVFDLEILFLILSAVAGLYFLLRMISRS